VLQVLQDSVSNSQLYNWIRDAGDANGIYRFERRRLTSASSNLYTPFRAQRVGPSGSATPVNLTVTEVILSYLSHGDLYYLLPDGTRTHEAAEYASPSVRSGSCLDSNPPPSVRSSKVDVSRPRYI
jgi:hypothetical protein